MLAAATPASAVVKGTSSSLGRHTVRLVGNGNCSGVVIARRVVVTAAHCADGMRVLAGGRSFRVAGILRSAVLDDGRNVSVSGDAAILKLASPLPSSVDPAPVGEGNGDTFTIAGYGTVDERHGAASGSLHEATLVAAEPGALIDPNRTGSIGASACFGDSGGLVMRGGILVGVITRAAHPSLRIACGKLTRWAPIKVSGTAVEVAAVNADTAVEETPLPRHRPSAKRTPEKEASSFSLFGNWFAPQAQARRTTPHKSAQR